jgi:tetratricopeptide (TPR) repeat protein
MSKTEATLSRKDMKEPDKFQQAATQAASWLASRRRHVAVAGIAAVAVLVLLAVLSAVQTRRAERAGAAASDLLAAMGGEISAVPLPGFPGPFYESEEARQRAIVAAADHVLADHGGTGAAVLAALAKGDASLRLRDWDGARAAYERFLADADRNDSLRFGALEGLGLAAEGKGDLDAAAAAYERLAREVPAFADRADLERARVLAQARKADEAREILRGFATKHPESTLAGEAASRLARLGAK